MNVKKDPRISRLIYLAKSLGATVYFLNKRKPFLEHSDALVVEDVFADRYEKYKIFINTNKKSREYIIASLIHEIAHILSSKLNLHNKQTTKAFIEQHSTAVEDLSYKSKIYIVASEIFDTIFWEFINKITGNILSDEKLKYYKKMDTINTLMIYLGEYENEKKGTYARGVLQRINSRVRKKNKKFGKRVKNTSKKWRNAKKFG